MTAVEGITEYRPANGLQVLLFPDAAKPHHGEPDYLVGSRMKSYGETGMAHLLEHLMFKGTPQASTIEGELTDQGMAFNGTTSYDRTNYFEAWRKATETISTWLSGLDADP